VIRLNITDGNRPLTLPAACAWLGEHTGKVPATSTMWRWALKGVRGGVRLESFRIGGTTYTTPAMIGRFVERTSQAVAVDVSPEGVQVRPAAVGAGEADARRRQQISTAHQRLKEICAPKRRARNVSSERRQVAVEGPTRHGGER
jgi:hypothetical protein